MPAANTVKKQINAVVRYLVEVGLASDQNFPIQRAGPGGRIEITFPHADHVSVAMKNRGYQEIYEHLARERAFSVKMPDGALVQMMYVFDGQTVERHRLAFFPAHNLEEFQNDPDIYLEDALYAEVVARSVVPFPLRFDYDTRAEVYRELHHPRSHLTLGQYENCRIPVTAALTPFWFVDFILRNFYHTAFLTYADGLPQYKEAFDESISARERSVVHLQIPVIAG